ncbi:hypothetical protein [Spiroplasma endosymbiont of Panzeria rudis]|uniref:hypothetical protein n=1 Tax=Spiroplasma endosymbiont of Panzeria rudis TaxID=3066301 RepID=UPI0030D412A5
MPLTYIEKEKLLQNEWEKRKKEAIKNINKKIPGEYLLKIFETIILDNDTKVNEENLQQSQEFETFEEKPLQDNENKQESKNWTQFKTDFPNIAQIIKNSKNTGIKILTSLITFFEINDDQLGITEYILNLNEERKKEIMNIKEIEEKIKNIWKEIKELESKLFSDEPLSLLSCSSELKEEKISKKLNLN